MTDSVSTDGAGAKSASAVIFGDLIELAVDVDDEAAEAVSELFNRYNGGGYEEDNEAGEAGGGGAVIEVTGLDDWGQPIPGKYRVVVKTYLKPGQRGETVRRQIEEGLWRLSLLYQIPEAQVRTVHEEDWAHAWKKFYKPLRIGRRVVLKPTWEEFEAATDDLVIHLDPGMAFGTGMHPTTRLCIVALEDVVQPGDAVLDLGTGSGVLAFVAARLGASSVLGVDIDPLAVRVARENRDLNGLTASGQIPMPLGFATGDEKDRGADLDCADREQQQSAQSKSAALFSGQVLIEQGSVPAGKVGRFQIIVANILAEVLVGLFDSKYGNRPLAEPLAPNGFLIMSGILAEKADFVLEAARRHGLQLVETKQEGDWVALVTKLVTKTVAKPMTKQSATD